MSYTRALGPTVKDRLLEAKKILVKIATEPEGAYSRDTTEYYENVILWCMHKAGEVCDILDEVLKELEEITIDE